MNFAQNLWRVSLLPSSDTEAEDAPGEAAEPLGAEPEEAQREFTVCLSSFTVYHLHTDV